MQKQMNKSRYNVKKEKGKTTNFGEDQNPGLNL